MQLHRICHSINVSVQRVTATVSSDHMSPFAITNHVRMYISLHGSLCTLVGVSFRFILKAEGQGCKAHTFLTFLDIVKLSSKEAILICTVTTSS